MGLLAAGSRCPSFLLTAAVSGREVSPAALKGKRAVLILHGATTTDAAKEVGKAVRARHPGTDVAVASLVNLRSMAGLWRKVAEAQIKSTYEKLAGKIEGDPADFIVIGPDWENAVGPLFGVEDSNRTPGVVVLRPDGTVAGVAEGAPTELAAKAIALLDDAA